jgi:hypothetical protein
MVGLLTKLAALTGMRVVVATRPLSPGRPFAPFGVLQTLGITGPTDPNLIDLDSDRFADPAALAGYTAELLAQHGADRPGPPAAAWSVYRTDHQLRHRLAAVIAARAGQNFLAAALTAVPVSTGSAVLDPHSPDFDADSLPSGIGEALTYYLDRRPDQRRSRDLALLTALAYGRGTGLDDPQWLAFATAIDRPATRADLICRGVLSRAW